MTTVAKLLVLNSKIYKAVVELLILVNIAARLHFFYLLRRNLKLL